MSAQWVIIPSRLPNCVCTVGDHIPSRLDINKKMLLIAHGPHHTYMGLVALFADLVQIRISMVCCTKLYKLIGRYCSRFSRISIVEYVALNMACAQYCLTCTNLHKTCFDSLCPPRGGEPDISHYLTLVTSILMILCIQLTNYPLILTHLLK